MKKMKKIYIFLALVLCFAAIAGSTAFAANNIDRTRPAIRKNVKRLRNAVNPGMVNPHRIVNADDDFNVEIAEEDAHLREERRLRREERMIERELENLERLNRAVPDAAGVRMYEVQVGDTLWKISERHGVRLMDVVNINEQIADPDLIYPNESVVVPLYE